MSISMMGNLGCYVDDNNTFSFQMGEVPNAQLDDPGFNNVPIYLPHADVLWQTIQGFNICFRGFNNRKCEEIERDIKENRFLPTLISKQVKMLYGTGPAIYKKSIVNGKPTKEWIDQPTIMEWLESWTNNGMECDYREYAKTNIKNFYTFRDFFGKFRFSRGKAFGALPLSGIESIENKHCRLATTRRDVATSLVNYRDFRYIAIGRWNYGSSNYQFYPRFTMPEVDSYNFAAVAHYREKSVGEYYGVNETHQGTRDYIKGSNETGKYINSFLKNSLAAKMHIVIPNAWIESKRMQITRLCEENKRRATKNEATLLYNGIEIGTEYKESSMMEYMQNELRNISKYLSGSQNQGKAFASISYKNGAGNEERWQIETVDLKYKEYIESLILYDKRADEVLTTAVGMDSSISSISKDGVISKSGADVYYNYLIYLLQLNPDDEICSQPFNDAIQINFPALYKQGYRIGFYRETPSRQEDVAPDNRLNKQQS